MKVITMIGKLTYEQIEQLITELLSSNENLRKALEYYNSDAELSLKTNKLLQFCNDIERYVSNLKEMLELNKDADLVINRLKENQ